MWYANVIEKRSRDRGTAIKVTDNRWMTLAFPLVLLATMVPLPTLVYSAVSAPLQLFASDVSTNLAQLLGVAVYRDGNIIHLANISLGVEEACSGLNSLSALMVVSLLIGFLICQRLSGGQYSSVISGDAVVGYHPPATGFGQFWKRLPDRLLPLCIHY